MNGPRSGFTLVELLVVLSIIGILLALLLPGVQSARELSRIATCRAHLRQLAMAFVTHENTLRFFPTGGWAQDGRVIAWGGVPGRGFGLKQPGGWGYNTLPFLEEQALFDLGTGVVGEAYLQAGIQRIHTPLSIHYCPSRRGAETYPNTMVKLKPYEHYGVSKPTRVAKTDYAANLGDPDQTCCPGYSPSNLASGDHPMVNWTQLFRNNHRYHSGISFSHSLVRLKEVRDGASHTYLIGEKHLGARFYGDGLSEGDDGTVYASHNSDLYRSTYFPPQRDTPPSERVDNYTMFGSAHASHFQMAMCDGSVHGVSYSIDSRTHRALGTRSGSEVEDDLD